MNKKLSLQSKFLYGVIMDECAVRGECCRNNSQISSFCGVKPRAVQLWLKELLEAGYISIRYSNDAKLKKALERNSNVRMISALVGGELYQEVYDLSTKDAEVYFEGNEL
jgi:hypothetical protein